MSTRISAPRLGRIGAAMGLCAAFGANGAPVSFMQADAQMGYAFNQNGQYVSQAATGTFFASQTNGNAYAEAGVAYVRVGSDLPGDINNRQWPLDARSAAAFSVVGLSGPAPLTFTWSVSGGLSTTVPGENSYLMNHGFGVWAYSPFGSSTGGCSFNGVSWAYAAGGFAGSETGAVSCSSAAAPVTPPFSGFGNYQQGYTHEFDNGWRGSVDAYFSANGWGNTMALRIELVDVTVPSSAFLRADVGQVLQRGAFAARGLPTAYLEFDDGKQVAIRVADSASVPEPALLGLLTLGLLGLGFIRRR